MYCVTNNVTTSRRPRFRKCDLALVVILIVALIVASISLHMQVGAKAKDRKDQEAAPITTTILPSTVSDQSSRALPTTGVVAALPATTLQPPLPEVLTTFKISITTVSESSKIVVVTTETQLMTPQPPAQTSSSEDLESRGFILPGGISFAPTGSSVVPTTTLEEPAVMASKSVRVGLLVNRTLPFEWYKERRGGSLSSWPENRERSSYRH